MSRPRIDAAAAFAGFERPFPDPPPADGFAFAVVATIRQRAVARAELYPLPDPSQPLAEWLRVNGPPPDWNAARRLLAVYGLRLPTATELRAGLPNPPAPAWVRDDPLRCLLSDGRLGHPGGTAERTLVAVRDRVFAGSGVDGGGAAADNTNTQA